MLSYTESNLKFWLKRAVGAARSVFLFFFGAKVTTAGWEERMLITNLEGMGDLVLFTSVLKHYKKRFPGKKVYLLIKAETGGVNEVLQKNLVDEVLTLKYRRFEADPLYGALFINDLRRIGFATVVNHDFSAAEIMGKVIAVSLGAREVIGYEGQKIEFTTPSDIQQEKHLEIIRKKIFPRYTKIIPAIPSDSRTRGRLPSEVEHYIAIYEGVTGVKEEDYVPTLPLVETEEKMEAALKRFGLEKGKYAIFNVNSSAPCKLWPLTRFARLAEFVQGQGLAIALIGSKKERRHVENFKRSAAGVQMMNLAGQTSFRDLIALIHNCFMVVTNDTFSVHMAIALKKPSLCIVGGGQFGVAADYGYRDINFWAYKKVGCYFDNWRCGRGLGKNTPAPCVAAVTVEDARKNLESLFDYLNAHKNYPLLPFSFGNEGIRAIPQKKKPLKIVYAGIQAENYNPERKLSFEYNNFYLTLKTMPGVEVIEYPYDPIVAMGRRKFNDQLLQLIKDEKPDLFFAFMFTDELDPGVLKEIMNYTVSVAWFADDHWRLHNYSRYYAPYFTWAVTTWSKAKAAYRTYGIMNVIRSQWACNTHAWKPVASKKDIEVSFVGQYNSTRAHIINDLRRARVNVWVRGWGWPEGRLSHEEAVGVISRSKINLNFNVPPARWRPRTLARLFFRRSVGTIVPDAWRVGDNFRSWLGMATPQIKARPFEVLGCRAFLISGFADDMDRYYEDHKEIVYYDGTTQDLVSKIRHYLPKDKEREKMAKAGYERTLREHTYEQRFRELFRAVGYEL